MPLLSPEDRAELDFEKLGAVLEPLVESDRLTDAERRAVELCIRATFDFLLAESQIKMDEFYKRDDVQQRVVRSREEWLANHPNAKAGDMVIISAAWHVASHDASGHLQLTRVNDPWAELPGDESP